MYSIGEFSKITGLTVKTLRFYQEQGLLEPTHVDEQSGYRYYAADKLEPARLIAQLRALEFSIDDIRRLLVALADTGDITAQLQQHRASLAQQAKHYRALQRKLDQFIAQQQEIPNMSATSYPVEEKQVPALLVAGIRMQGKYMECGKVFGQLGRKCGRHICGAPLMLIYDSEYKENDANFEPCMPIRKAITSPGLDVRELPGGACVALLHEGPYEELGRSYQQLLDYVHEKQLEVQLPTREVYLKGPGMIFRGNPKKYLTEIQMLVKR
jgi:DNA-binding transcriptional MerR regulator/effector-binding domain-containing protein